VLETHDDGKNKREAILETKEGRDTSTGKPRQSRHAEEAIVIVTKPARASGNGFTNGLPGGNFACGVGEVDVLFLCPVGVRVEDVDWWSL